LGSTPRDFLAFYTGGLIVREGLSDSLYSRDVQEATQQELLTPDVADRLSQQVRARVLPFLNPPFVAVLFAPLTVVSLPQAYAWWVGINIGLLVALIALLTFAAKSWSLPERLVAASAGLTFLPAYFTVWQGQISILLSLVVVLGWMALTARREVLGGLALSALWAKPQYAVLIPVFLLWQRQWGAILGFLLGTLLLLAVSVLVTGAQGMWQWVSLLAALPGLGSEYGHHPELQFTWSGFISAVTDNAYILGSESSPLVTIWLSLQVLTLVGLAVVWLKHPGTSGPLSDLQFSALLIGMLLLSLHTNVQDLAILIVVGYLTWSVARLGVGRNWTAILFLGGHVFVTSLFLARIVSPTIPYPNLLLVPLTAFALALIAVLANTVRRVLDFTGS
jgi:hypothetical protein